MTKDEEEMLTRLRFTVGKLAKWAGIDHSELIEDELLKEGDLG